jgi:DNA processing protein
VSEGQTPSVTASATEGVTRIGPELFPHPLALTPGAPAALYLRGRPFGPEMRVAVVGARRCSRLGREIAIEIGRGLAAAGVTVVSGAARGIDTAAHEGALGEGGWTVAVLGSGIDVLYPRGNSRLFERILATGTVVSEYGPGERAYPSRFPERNRIIAGMCRAVVLVEGAERSGTLSTTRHALASGISVYAVPGAVTDPRAAVPLAAIRDGATLIRSVKDLLEDLGLEDRRAPVEPAALGPEQLAALEAVDGRALPEAVAARLGCDIPRTVALLMDLEMMGMVRAVGGRYERTRAAEACLPRGV